MENRDGIFAGGDPFAIASAWLEEARETEPSDPDAVALASVDADGLPNVRIVLLRGLEADAFVFFTNYESAKGQELEAAGKAAFVLHWKSLKRQVRVRGLVERADGETSDKYYSGRPLGSRIGAWASQQSRPLADRETLMKRVAEMEATHGGEPERPPHWGGYRLRPLEMEFWAEGAHRLHDRFKWDRSGPASAWNVQRLYP